MSSASEVVYYGIVDVVATPFFNFFERWIFFYRIASALLARYLLFPLLSFRYVAAWHCWENEKPERTVVAFSMVLLWFD